MYGSGFDPVEQEQGLLAQLIQSIQSIQLSLLWLLALPDFERAET